MRRNDNKGVILTLNKYSIYSLCNHIQILSLTSSARTLASLQYTRFFTDVQNSNVQEKT